MENGWYKYETHYAVGAIKIENNKITKTAPIFKKLIGKGAYVIKGKSVKLRVVDMIGCWK